MPPVPVGSLGVAVKAFRQMLMIDEQVEVRRNKVFRDRSRIARLKRRDDTYDVRFRDSPKRRLKLSTSVDVGDSCYKIGISPLRPPKAPDWFLKASHPATPLERDEFERSQVVPGLPVRWGFDLVNHGPNLRANSFLQIDPVVWPDFEYPRLNKPLSIAPNDLVDQTLVEVTESDAHIADDWEHIEVDVHNNDNDRRTDIRARRSLIYPRGPIPLVFALRRWHLSHPLLFVYVPRQAMG
jgi:hypothetical protein